MAKKSRRKRKSSGTAQSAGWGGPKASKAQNRKFYAIVGVIVAVALIGGGLYWWRGHAAEQEFLALAAAGRDSLADREVTHRDDGRGHFPPTQSHVYPSRFPTSGRHATIWTNPGFYDTTQRPTMLLHAAEHGNIVIYYDKPDAETLARLKTWTGLYGGRWEGMVATRMPGLRAELVLTAWRKSLRTEQLDATAAAFIDTYRGRGPEHPVR